MKSAKLSIAILTVFAFLSVAAFDANAQFGGMLDKVKDKTKEKTNKAKDDAKKKADEEAKKAEEKVDGKINSIVPGGASKKTPAKPATTKTANDDNQSKTAVGGDETATRQTNAENLAKSAGMPKAVNTDQALNKLLFQAADDVRLIPRKVVIVDRDWFTTTGARNERVRRIFAVIGRTTDDGKCGKQMVQFDQDWKAEKNAWGLIYVQNIGAVTPVACSAIGK